MKPEEKKVKQLKKKLLKTGPMLPGTINKQFNICGKAGCKCKDPDKPIKHGPYYQISFAINGKSSSMFVKNKDIYEAKKRIKAYHHFRKLCTDLTQAYINLTRKIGFRRNES